VDKETTADCWPVTVAIAGPPTASSPWCSCDFATLHVASVSTPATSECCWLRGDRHSRHPHWFFGPRLFPHQLLRFQTPSLTPTCSFPPVWHFHFHFHFIGLSLRTGGFNELISVSFGKLQSPSLGSNSKVKSPPLFEEVRLMLMLMTFLSDMTWCGHCCKLLVGCKLWLLMLLQLL